MIYDIAIKIHGPTQNLLSFGYYFKKNRRNVIYFTCLTGYVYSLDRFYIINSHFDTYALNKKFQKHQTYFKIFWILGNTASSHHFRDFYTTPLFLTFSAIVKYLRAYLNLRGSLSHYIMHSLFDIFHNENALRKIGITIKKSLYVLYILHFS